MTLTIILYDMEGRLLTDDNEVIGIVKFADDQDLNSKSAILPTPEGVANQGVITIDVYFNLVPNSIALIDF